MKSISAAGESLHQRRRLESSDVANTTSDVRLQCRSTHAAAPTIPFPPQRRCCSGALHGSRPGVVEREWTPWVDARIRDRTRQ